MPTAQAGPPSYFASVGMSYLQVHLILQTVEFHGLWGAWCIWTVSKVGHAFGIPASFGFPGFVPKCHQSIGRGAKWEFIHVASFAKNHMVRTDISQRLVQAGQMEILKTVCVELVVLQCEKQEHVQVWELTKLSCTEGPQPTAREGSSSLSRPGSGFQIESRSRRFSWACTWQSGSASS